MISLFSAPEPVRPRPDHWLRIRIYVRAYAAHLWARLVYRTAKVDQNAKCPGCGHRRGRIELVRNVRLIKHTCLVCGANWGEATVVEADAWLPKEYTIHA